MNKALAQIREDLEFEGFDPAAPNWERVFTARKVLKCQELQGVLDCASCRVYYECDLAAKHMMYSKYGDEK